MAKTSRNGDALTLTGHEEIVGEYVRAKAAEERAAKRMAIARAMLEPLARDAQRAAERRGSFTANVTFSGPSERITFSFTNAFSALDPGNRIALHAMIGPVSDELFEVVETVSVRPGAVEKLRNAVIAAGQDPADYFDTHRVVKPRDEFRRRRFEARDKLTEEQNAALDEVMDQLAAKPKLSVK